MHEQERAESSASTVITDVVDKYDVDLVDLRRDLHAHPELSWSELRTAEVGRRPGRAGRLAGDALQPHRLRGRPR